MSERDDEGDITGALVAAVRKHLRDYHPRCDCPQCVGARTSGLADALAAFDRAGDGLPRRGSPAWEAAYTSACDSRSWDMCDLLLDRPEATPDAGREGGDDRAGNDPGSVSPTQRRMGLSPGAAEALPRWTRPSSGERAREEALREGARVTTPDAGGDEGEG